MNTDPTHHPDGFPTSQERKSPVNPLRPGEFQQTPKGHDLFLGTQTLPHELLFEIGLNAIEDLYYREAVSSFASSLERFLEFAVHVLSNAQGAGEPALVASWKKVSSQSERQLGAYIFLYLVSFGEPASLLNNKMTELRNDVVHKGRLPDKSEAIAFGDAVYKLIQDCVQKLRIRYLEHVNKMLSEHVNGIARKMGSRYPRSFQVTSTALNIIQDNLRGYRSFEQILLEHGISLATSED